MAAAYAMRWPPLGTEDQTAPATTAQATDTVEEVTAEQWMLPVPVAQQVFSIASGIAGGLAGIMLAQKFTQKRAYEVRADEVILATALSFAATFGAVFLIRSFKTFELPPSET